MNGHDAFGLAAGEIHAWSFALDLSDAVGRRLAALLSADEQERAAAFHFAHDRAHFSAARGRLRELLAGYLGTAPAALRFETGTHGKPRLAADFAAADIRFNLSHSHGQGLVAVTRGVEVGVDLEQMRADVDAAGIVASHFSPAERAAWAALPEAQRHEAFFHGWVRKEAYVKARGEGLSHDSAAYTVELEPAARGALLADALSADAARAWRVEKLAAPAGFAAAIAYASPEKSVRLRSA